MIEINLLPAELREEVMPAKKKPGLDIPLKERIRFTRNYRVGLQINSRKIRLVRLQSSSKGLRLVNARTADLNEHSSVSEMYAAAVSEKLANLFVSADIKAKEATVVVDDASIYVCSFQVSKAFTDDLKDGIRWYAEQYIPYPVDKAIIDYRLKDSRIDGKADVILVATKKEVIKQLVSIIHGANIKPKNIDIIPFATFNVFIANYNIPKNRVVALVNLCEQSNYVTIVKNNEIEMIRHFSSSANETAEDLIQKIELTFRYFEDQCPSEIVDRVFFVHNSSKLKDVEKITKRKLSINVEMLDPIKNIDAASDLFGNNEDNEDKGLMNSFSVAIGAAI